MIRQRTDQVHFISFIIDVTYFSTKLNRSQGKDLIKRQPVGLHWLVRPLCVMMLNSKLDRTTYPLLKGIVLNTTVCNIYIYIHILIQRDVKGDASDSAILKCVESILGKTSAYRRKHPKVAEIPFNSFNKYKV